MHIKPSPLLSFCCCTSPKDEVELRHPPGSTGAERIIVTWTIKAGCPSDVSRRPMPSDVSLAQLPASRRGGGFSAVLVLIPNSSMMLL